ncbi:hypothetical protein IAU60_002738 [Kwoniella sp. DSM 27419]
MQVVAHGLQLIGATAAEPTDTPSISIKQDVRGRYTLGHPSISRERNTLGVTIDLVFHPDTDEKRTLNLRLGRKLSRATRSRGWKRLKVTDGARQAADVCAYQLHTSRSAGYAFAVLIFVKPDTANFLGAAPGTTPLGDLTLPGTHESCALYGFPFSQCQQPSTPILQQLTDGVRFLDVRLRVVDNELLMYHGPRPQRSSLTLLLTVLHEFLDKHPTETLILSLKEESPPSHPNFSARIYQAFKPFLSRWFLEERIPTLGEVRGKGMLLTRFDRDKDEDGGWDEGMGIHPSRWPDSRLEGFEWDCHGTTVRTQDWYRVHTFLQIPEKFEAITSNLRSTLDHNPSSPFTLSYTSASYFPLSLPPTIAKGFGFPAWGFGIEGINARFCRYLLHNLVQGKRIRACVAMDFYRQCAGDEGLAGLLVLMNSVGEEGS